MNVTYIRVGRGMRSDTAYGVEADGVFVGYVVGRGGWSAQPEYDPTEPVAPPSAFTYAYPSRAVVTRHLIAEAQDAGLIGASR